MKRHLVEVTSQHCEDSCEFKYYTRRVELMTNLFVEEYMDINKTCQCGALQELRHEEFEEDLSIHWPKGICKRYAPDPNSTEGGVFWESKDMFSFILDKNRAAYTKLRGETKGRIPGNKT